MILLDFNGVVFGTIVMNKLDCDEDIIRHMALNSIRMYNKKFRHQYGQMVICCDSSTWRKDYFPNYKAQRKKGREADAEKEGGMDWARVFEILNNLLEDLEKNFPYKVVKTKGAEADDIIAVLVEETQEFGKGEDVMIVSADKDFIQLHKYNNVRQWSTHTKKFLQEKNPTDYIQRHIFKGDSSDGVPNVLSPDDVFLREDLRQSPVTAKKIEYWMENLDNLEAVMDQNTYRNYIRNKNLIDLSCIPDNVKQDIINTYESVKTAPKMKILNYLITKRCRNLIDCVGDFH